MADAAAKELKTQGQNLGKENPSDMIEYQAKTQKFAQMMYTFINAIKTIGEAQTTALRKGRSLLRRLGIKEGRLPLLCHSKRHCKKKPIVQSSAHLRLNTRIGDATP